ncbi:MAG TPA: magnesium transporter CorA family protein [Sphingomicrobium sp.]|nr:magnesium transporter CorA family protein [Sphingomicrobium sp.]
MLRVYGPGCTGELIDPKREKIPQHATWIDLEEPTREEELLVERCLEMAVPTPEEMAEIEPSSRLYESDGALYMTVSILFGVEGQKPSVSPIGFVLAGDRLVTVRYVTPKPIRAFADHARREPDRVTDAVTALCGILDSIIDRLADELEAVGTEIEKISSHIFSTNVDAKRIPVERLTSLLTRIGKTHLLLAKIRETETSTSRLLSFLSGTSRMRARRSADAREHLASLVADTASLGDHSVFLANHLYFLLDAAVGFISIEQNAAMKLFSWAALVFLPPTLIAGIYGMNFRHMPELHWLFGYPFALVLIVASASLPLWYLKRKGWI